MMIRAFGTTKLGEALRAGICLHEPQNAWSKAAEAPARSKARAAFDAELEAWWLARLGAAPDDRAQSQPPRL